MDMVRRQLDEHRKDVKRLQYSVSEQEQEMVEARQERTIIHHAINLIKENLQKAQDTTSSRGNVTINRFQRQLKEKFVELDACEDREQRSNSTLKMLQETGD